MSKKEEREMKLREICLRISKLTYKDLQDEFPTEFKDKINSYRDSVVAVLGSADSKLISVINKRFNTDDYKNKDGKKKVAKK